MMTFKEAYEKHQLYAGRRIRTDGDCSGKSPAFYTATVTHLGFGEKAIGLARDHDENGSYHTAFAPDGCPRKGCWRVDKDNAVATVEFLDGDFAVAPKDSGIRMDPNKTYYAAEELKTSTFEERKAAFPVGTILEYRTHWTHPRTVTAHNKTNFTVDGIGNWGLNDAAIVVVSRPGTELKTSQPTTTMSVTKDAIQFFRDMGKSKEDKLMREHGIEDPIGTPTPKGIQLLQEHLYAKHRDELKAIVKEMDAEDKKSKKE